MPTVVLSKLTQRWWKDENPTVGLSNLTRRWRGTENPTVVMPYLAQRRLKNGNSTVALPTLILRWFNVVKPTPTITTFYRRWFDVTLQSGYHIKQTEAYQRSSQMITIRFKIVITKYYPDFALSYAAFQHSIDIA